MHFLIIIIIKTGLRWLKWGPGQNRNNSQAGVGMKYRSMAAKISPDEESSGSQSPGWAWAPQAPHWRQ